MAILSLDDHPREKLPEAFAGRLAKSTDVVETALEKAQDGRHLLVDTLVCFADAKENALELRASLELVDPIVAHRAAQLGHE